ncbi:MAG: CPBP family intramembrane metalloprotease [Oxalobacteraceae bacterium]|nr:MAG: CPBP family intramembrane metalloprotease [Oxalobacteraceae bacterium]
MFTGAAIGALAGGAILGAVIAWRRGKPTKVPKGIDITPMLPRNGAELLYVVPLVLNAGISEEIFFRVYLPLLLVLAGVESWVAFAASVAIFGLLHRYQGWLGVLITTMLGAVFTLLYLGSGGLLLPILFHLLVNANALLVRPAFQLRFRRGSD